MTQLQANKQIQENINKLSRTFYEKLMTTNTSSNAIFHLPMHHGKYDGIIYALHILNQSEHYSVDNVIQILTSILLCFVDIVRKSQVIVDLARMKYFLSFDGLLHLIHIFNVILMKSPKFIYTKITEDNLPKIYFILSSLLLSSSQELILSHRCKNPIFSESAKHINMSSSIVKVLCLPLSINMDQSLFYEVLCSCHKSMILESLLSLTENSELDDINIAVGLFARLVLTDDMFVSQLKSLLAHKTIINLLKNLLKFNMVVISDVLAVLSHLARQSADYVKVISNVFEKGM